jgi:hypothetical protein
MESTTFFEINKTNSITDLLTYERLEFFLNKISSTDSTFNFQRQEKDFSISYLVVTFPPEGDVDLTIICTIEILKTGENTTIIKFIKEPLLNNSIQDKKSEEIIMDLREFLNNPSKIIQDDKKEKNFSNRGMNAGTLEKIKELEKIRRASIKNNKVGQSRTKATNLIGIDYKTLQKNAQDLLENWDDPEYHWGV